MQLLLPCLSDITEESGSDDSNGGNSPKDAVSWSDTNSPIETPPLGRRRRCRTQFSGADLSRLESAFISDPYPDVRTREQLADLLRVTEDRIQVWFQNHRAKVKRRLMTTRRPTNTTTTTSTRHSTHPGGTIQPPAAHPSSRDTQEGWQHPFLTCIPPVGSCGGFMGGMMPGGAAQRVHHVTAHGYGGDVRMPGISPPGGEEHLKGRLGASDQRKEYQAAAPFHLQEALRPLTSSTPNPPPSICEVTSSTTTKDSALEKRTTSPCTTNTRPGGPGGSSRVGNSTGTSAAKFKPRRPWEDEPRDQGMKRLLQDVHVDYLIRDDAYHNQFHYVNVGQDGVGATGQLYIDTACGPMHVPSPFYFPQEGAGMQFMPGLSVYPNMCNMGVIQSEQYGQFCTGWPLYKGALTARL